MTDSITQAADNIAYALYARDLPTARRHFDDAVQGNKEALDALVKRLAADVEIPEGAITVGFGIDVWGNPHRSDYVWRCGDCPWTGSGYEDDQAARDDAEGHAADHREKGEPAPAVRDFSETFAF